MGLYGMGGWDERGRSELNKSKGKDVVWIENLWMARVSFPCSMDD